MDNIFNINGYNLDNTQISAIKSINKNTLVIAGAGSGKTLTILGKIKYEIEINKINLKDILCISFTNEAINSLKNKLLNLGYDIEVLTFHKLGLKLLNNNNYSIINDKYLSYIIDEYFRSYIKYDKSNNRLFKNLFFTDINIDKIFNTNEYNNLKILIETFIHLLKSNNQNEYDIYKYYKHTYLKEHKILKYILDIYLIYKRELESSNKLDFDDMITLATSYIKENKLTYKLIIIDEFQDTSKVRLDLIKEIIKYTNASLFVVGDDYQSIYRFSGCDLNIFINFNKYFKDTKYYYLKYTYRNSNELIYVSVSFIMKNKYQLKKNIISNKNLNKPIKILFNFKINEVIKYINDENLLILGRNNKDLDNINWNNKLTIHKSKGLEANNVLLVNSDDIPSTIKNNYLLRFVLNNKDYIPFEEERRLFYVALTRTKNYIYILVNKKISPFIKELIRDYKNYINIIKK